ncbi:Gfo/Idh/MocA family oxidoreductase [soil metagenome]
MRVGIIGCGYVFDHYMSTWSRHSNLVLAGVADVDAARLSRVAEFYGLKAYGSNQAMLDDPDIDIVANFTSIEDHFDVTRAALMAGKHVYSEKPLTTDLDQARALMALAAQQGVVLSCAPSNALGDTSQTMWKAVRDGAVGDVRIVYADFDDNPIYLMSPEHWRSKSGAPWPYIHEYEQGCTFEHAGYHLTWLCAIFGPVDTVTAFSSVTAPDKTALPLHPSDTPDFSVACLNFRSGVVARLTCSIAAPYDHRMRIIGNKGMLSADTYRHYRSPVRLERFSKLSMNARKAVSVRTNTLLQGLFGVGGRPLKLVRNAPPGANGRHASTGGRWWSPRDLIGRLKRKELGQQDKCIGIAELADAVATGRPCFPSADFILHVTELTLAIQRAGKVSETHRMTTDFTPPDLPAETRDKGPDYSLAGAPGPLTRWIDRLLDGMHSH